MKIFSIFLSSILLSFVACTWIARWYVMPAIRNRPFEQALPPLLLFQCFRYIGLAFLIPGVVSPDLPTGFAKPAGYGDLVSSLLAFVAIAAVRFRWKGAIHLVWLFNVVGFLDLINAFVQAVLHRVSPGQLGVMYFIPTLRVPSLYVVHIMIFALLIRHARAPQV